MKAFRISRYLLFTGVCLLVMFNHGLLAAENALNSFPERIVLNITQTPHNSQAITWKTRETSTYPRVQVIRAAELLNPESTSKIFSARTTAVDLDKKTTAYHHSVVLGSLEPNTLYAYRVGDDSCWSEWNQFRTASNISEPFTFLYFGDIQEQVHSMCSQIFRVALQTHPESKFWLFAGDMVNNGPDDMEWEKFFNALGWIPRTVPFVLLPGNHEYPDRRFILPKDYHITNLWRPHFTLPENGPKGLEETVFSFDYQGVCFIMLNGNEQIETQAGWLEKILSHNKQPWIIVAIHQPVYSISKRRNRTQFQEILVPIFDQFSVDLVLQGHDHGYCRTFPLKNHLQVPDGKKGTVYVISNAGPKFYPPSSRYDHLMAKTGSREMLFQSVRVDKNTLHYTTRTVTNKVYDTFEIHK
ncbi:purple acid phosphatase family protein [Desulfobacula phenolica]|uniref:Calcineurin-like phosphoesterase n=1 Tax=Desulfobacula phenolica TaxID=90732 RepID=A0A1H2FHG7_9BACT|nr:metallophosphoesterase family protein [Desulfobacula phenolica]SDU06816.1 Calcineurin-like phosphoesterase [Desulfobacula phenolica]